MIDSVDRAKRNTTPQATKARCKLTGMFLARLRSEVAEIILQLGHKVHYGADEIMQLLLEMVVEVLRLLLIVIAMTAEVCTSCNHNHNHAESDVPTVW